MIVAYIGQNYLVKVRNFANFLLNQGPNVYIYVVVGWERLPKKYHQMYESVLVFINRINFLQE